MATDINYGIWNAVPNAVNNFMQAFQQSKQMKRQNETDDLAKQKAQLELKALEAKVNTPTKTYGDYGLADVPEYLKGAQASPEQVYEFERTRKGDKDKQNQISSTQVAALRDDYVKASQEFTKQTDALTRVRASSADPSPAGDLSMIFNYMKVLDPGSTVREGEFAQAASAGSLPTQFQQFWDKKTGGFFLTPQQRADFVDRSEKLYEGAGGTHGKRKDEYARLAKLQGLDPNAVIIALEAEARKPGLTESQKLAQTIIDDPEADAEEKAWAKANLPQQ